MTQIKIYEGTSGCATGQTESRLVANLARISMATRTLNQRDDVQLIRYDLTQDSNQFICDQRVADLIAAKGGAALPITMVDNEIVKQGQYPTTPELARYCDGASVSL
ncbi:arsenic metallochaperone ArsD family protein [Levilactobacillus enshiensis]|uniref:arsenic metallochaperone ArsD family protein n=1 Tax=Levilactobacillus enshiensis TaxID=2590213 RepID=UPI00117A22E7|nr:arsenic metallochaperone ArsD family protein [Levilactobacillus enshiensis]